jgi:hypothetical protein
MAAKEFLTPIVFVTFKKVCPEEAVEFCAPSFKI